MAVWRGYCGTGGKPAGNREGKHDPNQPEEPIYSTTFKWKDYRVKGNARYKTMTLATEEFIRRFLLHVLPSGFHRIRHYGLFANAGRQNNLARARELLCSQAPQKAVETLTSHTEVSEGSDPDPLNAATFVCPECGAPMIVIDVIAGRQWPRAPPNLRRVDRCV